MLSQPFDRWFDASPRRVLVAGAGGGFDVVAGMPVALALEARGHDVHLANLSWTSLAAVEPRREVSAGVVEITADSAGPSYFPEAALARWRRSRGERDLVYCFPMVGCRQLRASYRALANELGVDTVVLVDGGVDSLLRGDERSLGTPTADAISIAAAIDLDLPGSFLATVAFGAQRHDGISHAQALERMADLTRSGGYLGAEAILMGTAVGEAFASCAAFVQGAHAPLRQSIVVASMQAALRGEFGETSVNARTEQTPIWISPLMNMAFYFDLRAVAATKRYLGALRETDSMGAAAAIIEAVQRDAGARPWVSIPI